MTQVIVALDVDTIHKQEDLLKALKGTITFYKIGLQLFTAHGKRAVDLVHRHGGRVFLDLKFWTSPRRWTTPCARPRSWASRRSRCIFGAATR